MNIYSGIYSLSGCLNIYLFLCHLSSGIYGVLLKKKLVITRPTAQQTWISPNGQYQNQIDYILCNQRCRRPIKSAKTRHGTDCGSDYEVLIAKFRLKLKKVRKSTRTFRYDINQIPCDYTVEVSNRFKG